jgi:hypothetical protein
VNFRTDRSPCAEAFSKRRQVIRRQVRITPHLTDFFGYSGLYGLVLDDINRIISILSIESQHLGIDLPPLKSPTCIVLA